MILDGAHRARAQLADLAKSAASLAEEPLVAGLEQLEFPGARPAAVLILFGVLDSLAAKHESQGLSGDLDVLLLVRAASMRNHPSQVAFPGGRIDEGDDGAVSAALREAEEETGVDPAGVEVLGILGQLPLERSGHLVTPVLAWWRQPSDVRVVDVAESAAVFRAPVADLLDPANRGTTVLHRDGLTLKGPAFRVLHDDVEYLVWGFTAMVLDALFERLGWTEPWDRSRELALDL